MSESPTLKFLAASAVHERHQADILAGAVPAAEDKAVRAQAALAAAKEHIGHAKADAKAQDVTATAAETALADALSVASPADIAAAGLPADAAAVRPSPAAGAGGSNG